MRHNRRWPAVVVIATAVVVVVMAAGHTAGAQVGQLTGSEVAAHIVAGDLVALRNVVIEGDLVLPRATRVTAPIRCRKCDLSASHRKYTHVTTIT